MDMEVTALDGDVTHVRLVGRLDVAGAEQIGVRFTAAVASQARSALVDMAGVEFVASMGLRLLISSAKSLQSRGATLVLYAPQPLVQEVLEHSAVDQIIPVAADQAAALERLAG